MRKHKYYNEVDYGDGHPDLFVFLYHINNFVEQLQYRRWLLVLFNVGFSDHLENEVNYTVGPEKLDVQNKGNAKLN
jgi:hypothetical protein